MVTEFIITTFTRTFHNHNLFTVHSHKTPLRVNLCLKQLSLPNILLALTHHKTTEVKVQGQNLSKSTAQLLLFKSVRTTQLRSKGPMIPLNKILSQYVSHKVVAECLKRYDLHLM